MTIAVATVLELREPYVSEALLLFRSIDRFGGALRAARRIAYSIGEPAATTSKRFESLGVDLRVTESVDERCPHANKLRMIRREAGVDVLLALDTDVVCVRDPSAWLSRSSLVAKPTDLSPLTGPQWLELFKHFGVTHPNTWHRTHTSGELVPNYFNSGVIGIPSAYADALGQEWRCMVRAFLDELDRLPQAIAEQSFYADQFALALAVQRRQLPIVPLPLAMNFPTHCNLQAVQQPDETIPYLIHHHHRRRPGGALELAGFRAADRQIRRANRGLRLR